MRSIIRNGSLILPSTIIKADLLIEDGIIRSLDANELMADEIIEASGYFVAPGFVDIHIHGGGGHDFMEASLEAFVAITEYHLAHGSTSLVPTAVSASFSDQVSFLSAYQNAVDADIIRVRMLGAHMEGPYLSENKKGAHDPCLLKNPNRDEYQTLIADFPFIKRWTIACELPGALAMGDYLYDRNINASIGHSNAFGHQITDAMQHGFTSVTHLYNATSNAEEFEGKKAAGIVETALLENDLFVEIIGDLQHVPAEMIWLTYKNKTSDKMILVSDCLSPAGMPKGIYHLGNNSGFKIEVGEAVYLAGTKKLAGSVASGDILLHNAIKIGIPITEAVKMLTLTPAKLLGFDKLVGSLEIGKAADIIIFDEDIDIKHLFCNGKKIK
ncbi:MAG: amidohydrolase family protein [Candidatus Izemoplasmatales bacterium]|nr:amidohydrolase family protein [Candidatus Izemoplasmatales bacterium]MDD3865017.1 amidohydrolase family protein [Candidatus Izemoplasmatales bacterium]